jgi:hypothetical protein
MANYKIVDADRLDADMTGLADVIRQRAGTAGKLEFPEEMKEAVRNIRGGVELPALDNPGTASDLAKGKQLIGADGSVIEGSVTEIKRDIYTYKQKQRHICPYHPVVAVKHLMDYPEHISHLHKKHESKALPLRGF